MIEIKEIGIDNGQLASERDIQDATSLILSHLNVEPDFIRTAPHTLDGTREWFGRKKLDAFWFAENNNQRVGMIGLSNHSHDIADESSPEDVEVCRLMVSPNARGEGIGRQLFHIALTACSGRSPWLTVLVGSDAELMYRRWGWTELGQVPSQDDPKDHIIAMRPSSRSTI